MQATSHVPVMILSWSVRAFSCALFQFESDCFSQACWAVWRHLGLSSEEINEKLQETWVRLQRLTNDRPRSGLRGLGVGEHWMHGVSTLIPLWVFRLSETNPLKWDSIPWQVAFSAEDGPQDEARGRGVLPRGFHRSAVPGKRQVLLPGLQILRPASARRLPCNRHQPIRTSFSAFCFA